MTSELDAVSPLQSNQPEAVRVFIPTRHGLGDSLAAYFSPINYGHENLIATRLKQLIRGRTKGLVTDIVAIYEAHHTTSAAQLWPWLGIMPKATKAYNGSDGVLEADVDNRFPPIVHGYRNLLTNLPPWWERELGDITGAVELPENRPPFKELPEDFILVSDCSGAADRTLDIDLAQELERYYPVIRFGQSHGRSSGGNIGNCVINWVNSLDLTEVFWLAKRAKLIVSAVSMSRCFASLFGTPVIEILQQGRALRSTYERTAVEYQQKRYGISPERNFYYSLPDQLREYRQKVHEILVKTEVSTKVPEMGFETSKADDRRKHDSIYRHVFKGVGIDIGGGGDCVSAERWPAIKRVENFDLGEGDANHITQVKPRDHYDFVYSSHCWEHTPNPAHALKEWWALVKPGGFLFVVVPDEDLYEQGVWPSTHNREHQWSFTLYKHQGVRQSWSPRSVSVMTIVTEAIQDWKLWCLRIADTRYDYRKGREDQTAPHPGAEANIELILQKLPPDGNWRATL